MVSMANPANPRNSANPFSLVGGRPCLDFVNTVKGRVSAGGRRGGRDFADQIVGERLTSFAAFVGWARLAGVVDAREAASLDRDALAATREADAVLRRAIALREAMYRLFKAAVERWSAREEDVATLNAEIQLARAHEHIVMSPRPGWVWDDTSSLDRVMWPIVRSAADLLTSPELRRIGQCPGEECGWLFLDTSRSGRRQWCEMATCGTLAKVRRFRRKRRRSSASARAH